MRFFLTVIAAFLGVFAAFIFIFLLFVAIIAAQDPAPSVSQRTVLLLEIDGPIPETHPEDPFQELLTRRATTLRQTIRALEKAAVDDRIVGVWLKPVRAQASWAALAELREALDAYRASGKPLVATSGDDGYFEPGYFLATTADSIYSPPEAMFEMNGFYVSAPFFGEMFQRLGIEPVVVKTGDYKSAAETFTETGFSPENREQYTELVRSIDERFRNTVTASRPIGREQIDEVIASGGIYTARDAAALGMIDALRYEHEVERLWRRHTRQDADEELRTISLRDYVRVPDSDAGLRPGDRRNRIALVYATGVIMPGGGGSDGAGGDVLGSERFVESIEEALRDDRTRAIVIRVDSPGGSATASDAMWAAVRDATERVPVVVSMGSVAASGGYYISAAADVIVAEEATITGSIGVISMLFDATAFLDDRLGVTIDTIRTGPAAGMFAMPDPVTEMEVEILQEMTERVYATFLERVAMGRNLDVETVRQLAGGRVYTGSRAADVGLADEVGGLRRAIDVAAERAGLAPDEFRLLVLPRRRPLFERLTEAFSAEAAVRSWMHHRMSGEERYIRQQAATLERAVKMHGTVQMRMLAVPEVR